MTQTSAPTLLSLPPELLHLIASTLPYPDLLALRHVHPTLYTLLLPSPSTNVDLKVSWLLDRKARHLRCPLDLPSSPSSRIPLRAYEFALHLASRAAVRVAEKADALGWSTEGIVSCKGFTRRMKLIQGLDLRSDEAFCRSAGGEVRRIMERRRGCGECGITCEVVRGRLCFGGMRQQARGKDERKRVEREWLMSALVVGVGLLLWWIIASWSRKKPMIHIRATDL